MRADGFNNANEEIALRINLEVDQMILLMVSRGQAEEVEFLFPHDKGEGKKEIREHADDDHEEGGER